MIEIVRGMEVRAAARYGNRSRSLAKAIKDPTNHDAMLKAAEAMAPLVPVGAILVPAPSSHGLNRAMMVLAQYVASMVKGAMVVEAVVRVEPVQSSHLRRAAGAKAVSVKEHVATLRKVTGLPPGRPVVGIDNVLTQGNTMAAVQEVLGVPFSAVVVYSLASGGRVRRNPDRPLIVCISGSRAYRSLHKVAQVFRTLPAGTLILHGGAKGVDAEANRVARALGFAVEVQLADWARYGRAAGPIRNRQMVERADHVIAFWDGVSSGTASSIAAARELGVEYEVILDD